LGHSFDSVIRRASFPLATPLSAGTKAQLAIPFKGVLTGSMTGYYKSTFSNAEGKPGIYALTQFEVHLFQHAHMM
jgi:aminopeptidase 2